MGTTYSAPSPAPKQTNLTAATSTLKRWPPPLAFLASPFDCGSLPAASLNSHSRPLLHESVISWSCVPWSCSEGIERRTEFHPLSPTMLFIATQTHLCGAPEVLEPHFGQKQLLHWVWGSPKSLSEWGPRNSLHPSPPGLKLESYSGISVWVHLGPVCVNRTWRWKFY